MNGVKDRTVALHCEIAAKLNFACHQSAYPVLRDLRIENLDEETRLDNVLVTLSADPGFIKQKSWRIDRIAASGVAPVRHRDIELDGGFLLNLSDSLRGTVSVRVETGSEVLTEETMPVELLAYNEWGGSGYMPELLPAFSMPNDPGVDRILHGASKLLRQSGKSDDLDGYKSGSRHRIWEMASAIYTAIANLGITYAVPPASFERDGQKIRLPSQILDGRVATCLDTTMLFASALEQAGLNPIIAMPEGHAMVGVWLQPEELSTMVIEDAETLRKRNQLQELILIETTLATSHPVPPFSKAVVRAMEQIAPERDETFSAAVDIRRARAHRILPLGLKGEVASTVPNGQGSEAVELPMEEAPALPDFDDDLTEDKPETPAGRLERWQRKLLDLSARNPLLNHKSTKASLKIVCPDPGLLEDKLADGTRISIQVLPQATSKGQDVELHKQRTGEVITEEYALDALNRGQVLVDLPPKDLSMRAVEIYRKAQTALQEGGANTLYLALGFLLWKRDAEDERRFRAPLILMPVTLQRQSVRSGVKMLTHDDEPRFNTTLLQMLHKDFGIDIMGLDGALLEDESGVDVHGIWNKVRQAVKDAPGFEVVEDVVLGHFSFAKFLMWKDLVDRTNALRDNPVVRHLIDTPHEAYGSGIPFVETDRIDRDYKPSDLLVPLPADSSQMAAIATADRGKDFIIIGPPGTGKSQTIGNVIAHFLGKGRKVLFVSEKTAALDVVYRRLDDIGLGRFCLELHSNKAKKADVLSQLKNAWSTGQRRTAEDWEKEAERLHILRDQLNRIIDNLHRRRRNGLTAHYAIGVKVRDEELASRINLSWPKADQHDEAQLAAMREAAEMLKVQAQAVGEITESPFQLVANSGWTPQWEVELVDRAVALSSAAESTDSAASTFCEKVGLTLPDRTLSRLNALADLARVLTESYRKQTAYALEPDGQDRIEALEEAVRRLKSYAEAQAQLSCPYDPMAWRKIDGQEVALHWTKAESYWWPKKFFAKHAVIKSMREGGARGKPNPMHDASLLTSLRGEGEAIDRLDKQLCSLKDWEAHTSDPQDVQALRDLGDRTRTSLGWLADDAQALAEARGRVRTLLQDCNDLLAPEAVVGRAAAEYLKTLGTLQSASQAFEERAGRAVREVFSEKKRALEALRETAGTIIARRAELHDWCAWRKRRTEAMDLDLAPLVDGIEQGRVPLDEIPETFEAVYCVWWSAMVIGEDEVLRAFSTAEHMDAIERFRQVDTSFQKITAAYIAAGLSGQIPTQDDVTKSSQWGVLWHEINKKKRHKPVRQLMQESPEAVTKLAPCLMMSPLSVAQYLPAEQSLFDVVIFDEASQITVWDAVGSVARGRQVIIAGDPKQMPPSNFFNRADDDPDGDVDYDGDLESILDELRSSSIPERTLNLHYRSRRESLIAFSNSRYYDNGLITFPAPIHPDHGVRLIRPDGFYARGKARHNEGEAKAIVAEVVRRLTSDKPAVQQATIGVVTFNSEQQSLIEDLLDRARAANPGIEWAFDEEYQEAVFVKNLETVQGDERDVILFSVTYGPDQSGHVTMNFGPLNREGGERRLNVALTRSRSEMVVFSTLHPDKIDLSRTNAGAVKDLKHFLEYAERGPIALGAGVHGSLGDFESPFETAVARSLREKGWTLHPQIGVSSFRIDIGIVHPDEPGIYLAGVECDGAMYHSAAFARERDRIRQAVLEGLGWTLFRVWSTDWWINKGGAIEKLDRQLREHLKEDRHRRQTAFDEEECKDPVSEDRNPVCVDDFTTSEDRPKETAPEESHRYVKARLDGGAFVPDPSRFYHEKYERRINAMIELIVDIEGPIHEDVLIRRIARHHDFQRAGRQIRELVLRLAKNRHGHTKEDVGIFFWQKRTVKSRLAPARYADRDEEMRKVEHICAEELQHIDKTLNLNGDVVELARALGIARLSQSAHHRLENILNRENS